VEHVGPVGSFVDSTYIFRLKGRGFESRFSCQVGILGKSFPRSYLLRVGVKLRRTCAVSGASLSSGWL